MSIVFHVENLRLRGVDLTPAQRARLGDALQQELTALLRERKLPSGVTARSVSWDSLAAPRIRMRSRTDGESAGRQIARAIYASLNDAADRPRAQSRQARGRR